MEGRNYGRMELWKDGIMEGWNSGRTELWKDGIMEGQNYGRMELWKDGIQEGQNAEYYVPSLFLEKAVTNSKERVKNLRGQITI